MSGVGLTTPEMRAIANCTCCGGILASHAAVRRERERIVAALREEADAREASACGMDAYIDRTAAESYRWFADRLEREP